MPNINIPNIDILIGDIRIPDIYTRIPQSANVLPPQPPVVVNIGSPVVNIPGCVEAHQQNTTRERNGILSEDDPKGVRTFCDAGTPSFNPIQYEPDQMIMTEPAPVPKTPVAPETPEVEAPEVKPPAPEIPKIECPTKVQKAQEPVGSYVEGFRKKVVRYELIDKTCVQITEEVPLPKQIVAGLPSGGQVVQVGGVAVIATTSALLAKPLADLLLRAVKPVVKKVVKKVATLRGKKPPILSEGERRAEQRQMNHAVKELRSVFPRRKKKK